MITEEAGEERLYTPHYGVVEARARVVAGPNVMTALWMIGFEDTPDRPGQICLFEVFGDEIDSGSALVGMGIHPFADPRLVDDFEKVEVQDVCEFRTYAVEWTPEWVEFFFVGDRTAVTLTADAANPGFPTAIIAVPNPGLPTAPWGRSRSGLGVLLPPLLVLGPVALEPCGAAVAFHD